MISNQPILQVSAHWWEMKAEENGFCGVASRFHFFPDEGGSLNEFSVNIFSLNHNLYSVFPTTPVYI